jgi:outer membrane receptor protein involved in Fe transport
MQKDDVIFQDSDRNNVSGGETKHRGIELTSVVDLTSRLSLDLVASYARHTYESNIAPLGVTVLLDGKDMDTAPKLVGNFQLNWDLTSTSRLNFEWVRMDSYYTDDANEHEYEGHDLLNMRYRYAPGDDWFFAARLLNVFDVDYAERADYTGFSGDRYFVGEPRSLYFTVGMNF